MRRSSPLYSQLQTLTVVMCLAIFAVVAAILIHIVSIKINMGGGTVIAIVQHGQAQFGFLAVALCYLSVCDSPSKYINFHLISIRQIVWLAGLLFLVPLLSAPRADWYVTEALAKSPHLWIVILVFWFFISVPSEELLFREIIQGRIKKSFSTPISIATAAIIFGIIHIPFIIIQGSSGAITAAVSRGIVGGVFGVVYERTGNLVLTSFAHAVFWVSPAALYFLDLTY